MVRSFDKQANKLGRRSIYRLQCTSQNRRYGGINGRKCSDNLVQGSLSIQGLRLYYNFRKLGRTRQTTLTALGFTEKGGTYRHSVSAFTVEFPAGPLSVGNELLSQWETLRRGEELLHILTPTDCCRDRLAAFYHWNDFSSLQVALAVAQQQDVNMITIKAWSVAEGSLEKFLYFMREFTSM